MNINFSSQSSTNSSFGKWKRITINNFDNIVDRAYAARRIMEANSKSQACFYTDANGPFNVTKSLFGIIEYIRNPGKRDNGQKVIDVYVNGRFPRKLFNSLKQCLTASTADEAKKIAELATSKMNKIV